MLLYYGAPTTSPHTCRCGMLDGVVTCWNDNPIHVIIFLLTSTHTRINNVRISIVLIGYASIYTVAVLHWLGCTVAGVRLDSHFDWRMSRLHGNPFFYTPVSLLGAIPCVVNCDAIGSLAGPVPGVGRLTRPRTARPPNGAFSCSCDVLTSAARKGRFAVCGMFPHR